MPTWGVGLLAVGIVYSATTMKLDQGESVVLQNSITGKPKGVVRADDGAVDAGTKAGQSVRSPRP